MRDIVVLLIIWCYVLIIVYHYSILVVTLRQVSSCCNFFFQAEDGIRDLVRSRGLGDVYKRQAHHLPRVDPRRQYALQHLQHQTHHFSPVKQGVVPVSYTHLTLPTSD